MSITLMAYPMAFLINPEDAKSEQLRMAADEKTVNKSVATQNLFSIRVLTNIQYDELDGIMARVDYTEAKDNTYFLPSGLKVHWAVRGKYVVPTFYGVSDAEQLQVLGESFFEDIDSIVQRNSRLIESCEYFYYNYETSYTKLSEIYSNLKQEGATEIFSTANNEVVANLNGQSIP